jgi:ribosomal protein S26
MEVLTIRCDDCGTAIDESEAYYRLTVDRRVPTEARRSESARAFASDQRTVLDLCESCAAHSAPIRKVVAAWNENDEPSLASSDLM